MEQAYSSSDEHTDKTFQPHRLFEHEEVIVLFDVELQQLSSERRDVFLGNDRLRVDQNRRRHVRREVRDVHFAHEVVHHRPFFSIIQLYLLLTYIKESRFQQNRALLLLLLLMSFSFFFFSFKLFSSSLNRR